MDKVSRNEAAREIRKEKKIGQDLWRRNVSVWRERPAQRLQEVWL